VQLGERLDPARFGQRPAEAHGLEVDEAGFQAARAPAQVDVRALEIAVVDAAAVHRDQQVGERIEHRVRGEAVLERERRRHAGPHVLEHGPGLHRHAGAAALEPRLGPRDADPAQRDPVAGAPGAARGGAAHHVGQRAAEPAPRRFLHDECAPAEHVARDPRATIVLEHACVRGGERLGVRGEQRAQRVRLERPHAEAAQALAAHPRDGAPRPKQAPRAPTRELLRAPVGGGARRAQRRAGRGVEGRRETERGGAQAHAVGARDERCERVLEAGEVARARGRAARAARVLPVEQDRGAGADQQVARVQVGVDPAGAVQAREQCAERGEQGAAGARRSRQQRRVEGDAFDPAHREQAVAVGQRAERERFRHRQAGGVQGGERAPLAIGGRAADAGLARLAPGMAPRADAELFQKDGATAGRDAQRAAPRVVRRRREGTGRERFVERALQRGVPAAPAHARESRLREGRGRAGHGAARRAPARRR
jgi:hypothetical protein